MTKKEHKPITLKPPVKKAVKPRPGEDSSGSSAEQLELPLPGIDSSAPEYKRRRVARKPAAEPRPDLRMYSVTLIGAMHMDGCDLKPGEKLAIVKLTPLAVKG